jgi:probable DNA metabolism protein
MLVFFFDNTFEGLLTAVFDAYNRKTFPDRIMRENDVPPLFMQESYIVITQDNKANRVWSALQKKMSKTACNMVSYVWLSETEDCAGLLFRYMKKMIDSPHSIETNFGDKDVLEFNQLAKAVSKEAQYLRQFVRFQKAADDIYFAPINPIYNALPMVVSHFSNRFSDQKWVIYDIKRKYGFYFDTKSTVEITLDDDNHLLSGKLDEALMAEDEKLFQELWKGYFKAMTIKERINTKLQKQHMPKRFWKYLTEKQ